MKARVLFCLVMISALPSVEGMPSLKPDCCTELGKTVPSYMLKHVKDVTVQEKDGVCDLRAIVLHFKKKFICVDPTSQVVQKWLCSQKKYQKQHDCSTPHRVMKIKPIFHL